MEYAATQMTVMLNSENYWTLMSFKNYIHHWECWRF